MPYIAELPNSNAGGGSSVPESEVTGFAELLRENPERRDAAAEAQEGFATLTGEKNSDLARKRVVSAGNRMRGRLAEVLDVEKDQVSSRVRAIETDAKGKPVKFTYWIVLKADAVKALQDRTEAPDETPAETPEDA